MNAGITVSVMLVCAVSEGNCALSATGAAVLDESILSRVSRQHARRRDVNAAANIIERSCGDPNVQGY